MKGKATTVLSIIVTLLVLLWVAPGAAAAPPHNAPARASAIAAPTASPGVLAIPAAAFRPFEDGYEFENHGRYLIHLHSPGGGTANGWYLAPVYLPHGAVVTKMTFYFKDTWIIGGMDGIAKLQRTQFNVGNFQDMAAVDSSGAGSGYTSKSTTAITYVGINNSLFAYWVVLDIPYTASAWSRFEACGVVIEYALPATMTGILSIPAAAFSTPFEDGYDFENHGRFLKHLHAPGGTHDRGWYLAPVRLPHGATVTEMTFYYRLENITIFTGTAKLQRTKLGQGNYEDMAVIVSTGTGTQYTSASTSSIQHNPIDNSQYAYWAIWDLPWVTGVDDVWGCAVVIEYTVPAAGGGPISISAAAFGTPFEDGYDFEDHGRYLKHFHSPGGGAANGWYLAPVHLPHGATVTKMTFHWHDTSSSDGIARLQRTRLGQGNYEEMATAATGVGPYAFGSSADDTILYAAIDNSQYAYWVVWDLPVPEAAFPTNNVWGCGVVIEYDFRLFLPLILRNSP